MIKAGQIYKHSNGDIFAILRKDFFSDMWYGVITKYGFTSYLGKDSIKNSKLLAEYPTWQEAVNSKEFNDD